MNHEPRTTLAAIAARAANRHHGDPGNNAITGQETVDEAIRLQQEDGIEGAPNIGDLLRAYWGQQYQKLIRHGSSHVKGVIGDTTSQGWFDLGDDYDLTILVCGRDALSQMHGTPFTSGRVVTLGQFDSTDVRLMALEQRINLQRQQAAHDRDQPRYTALSQALAAAGNYYQYRQAQAHG